MMQSSVWRHGFLGLVMAASGCGGAGADGRQAVSGLVTLDGAPLAHGEIAFDPVSGGGDAVSGGAVITDGAYAISGEGGLKPGNYRVSIRSAGEAEPPADEAPGMPPSPREAKADPIPEKYNADTKLTAEIKEGGSTEKNFELTSK